MIAPLVACLLASFAGPPPLPGPVAAAPQNLKAASWIWGGWSDELDRPAGERCLFRREFDVDPMPRRAVLVITADNAAMVKLNGQASGRSEAWETATMIDVTAVLNRGRNRLEILAQNQGGPAGMIAQLVLLDETGPRVGVATDATWETHQGSFATGPGGPWEPARVIGPFGCAPWGDVPLGRRIEAGDDPVEDRFEAPPGFRVDEAYAGLDSYVSLALGEAGSVFVGAENGAVYRLTDDDRDGRYDSEELYTAAVKGCHGIVWHEEALYCVGKGPDGMGLYRVTDETRDAPERIGGFDGDGEHGPHAVTVGPDGALWLAVGNHSSLSEPWSDASPYRTFYEGHLLPRYVDPRGHAVDVDAPGGVVARVAQNADGRWDWQVIAGGFRNAYDVAFLSNGDAFTFDSDMEWDIGLPWYREVRLVHVVPGGEYGWRTGSTKWPDWYPDSLPPACEVGRGSPCGMVAYDGAMFPHRYTDAVLAADWSRGRVLAFFPEPDGVSYTASYEELVLGRPLNAVDLEVDADGALLIATGGRGTEGALWRLSYEGERGEDAPRGFAEPMTALDAAAAPENLDVMAPLVDDDRFTRFASMLELERRGFATQALTQGRFTASETAQRIRADALIAGARAGFARKDAEDPIRGIEAALGVLASVGNADLSEDGSAARRIALRAIDLFLQDDDAPPASELGDLGARLLALYPTRDAAADYELAMLLAYLAPEGAVDALVLELQDAVSRADGLHLLYCLRCVETGWSDRSRKAVTAWLHGASAAGGESFGGYVELIRKDLQRVFGAEHAALLDKPEVAPGAPAKPLRAVASARSIDATLEFLAGALESDRRSLDEGALVFAESCARCHPFHGVGHGATANTLQGADGTLGPDLAGSVGRYSRADLLDAIARPSRVVPEAYRATDVFLNGGDVVSGMLVADTADELVIAKQDGTRVTIAKDDIDERRESPLSIMPDGLLESLTLEQIADLVFYLASDAPHPAPETSQWTSLFDGKTLEGWRFDPELWSVQGGVIVGKGEGLEGSSFLISNAEYGDFALEFDLFVVEGNSGLQFRSTPAGDFGLHGYQADAGEQYWGSLYEEGGRGMLHRTDHVVWQPAVRHDDWNHYSVQAIGDRIVIEINGAVTTDLRDGERASGLFGFQLHAGASQIWLRAIRVRPL